MSPDARRLVAVVMMQSSRIHASTYLVWWCGELARMIAHDNERAAGVLHRALVRVCFCGAADA